MESVHGIQKYGRKMLVSWLFNSGPYSLLMYAQLKSLEQKLDELIRLTHNLRGENFALRQKIVLAENNKQELQKRIDLAANKLETLIERKKETSPAWPLRPC